MFFVYCWLMVGGTEMDKHVRRTSMKSVGLKKYLRKGPSFSSQYSTVQYRGTGNENPPLFIWDFSTRAPDRDAIRPEVTRKWTKIKIPYTGWWGLKVPCDNRTSQFWSAFLNQSKQLKTSRPTPTFPNGVVVCVPFLEEKKSEVWQPISKITVAHHKNNNENIKHW